MKIEKAIEILETHQAQLDCNKAPDLWVAIHLGIQALARCRTLAQESPLWALHPLPSETKEEELKRR